MLRVVKEVRVFFMITQVRKKSAHLDGIITTINQF